MMEVKPGVSQKGKELVIDKPMNVNTFALHEFTEHVQKHSPLVFSTFFFRHVYPFLSITSSFPFCETPGFTSIIEKNVNCCYFKARKANESIVIFGPHEEYPPGQ